jgi:hypothetical protein
VGVGSKFENRTISITAELRSGSVKVAGTVENQTCGWPLAIISAGKAVKYLMLPAIFGATEFKDGTVPRAALVGRPLAGCGKMDDVT